ncbi:MAG TPA: CRISPR-associated RAMP protein Csx7 [Kofleriaceae bacterium]
MTVRVDDFHRLESRLRLTGVLITRTALRIGGGGGDLDGVDLPVIKDAAGFPFIPGASLKGALRSTVEALVRGADGRAAGLWACDPLAGEDSPLADRSCGHHERGKRADVKPDVHCAVCRLFGSHVVASHVRFCDALMRLSDHDRAFGRVPVEVRDGVSIDRDLRRARGSRKFDFEVVSPGTEFTLEIFVENPQAWLMGLLVMGFDQLAEGFTALGGFTSRGLGRVSFAWSSIVRVTAAGLLRGDPPAEIMGDAVAAQMRAWREALAAWYREAA